MLSWTCSWMITLGWCWRWWWFLGVGVVWSLNPSLHWNLLGLIITPELRASATVLGLWKLSRCRCYFPVYWVVTSPRESWHVHFAFCIAHSTFGWTADDSTLHLPALDLGRPLYTLTWGIVPSDVLTMHVITTCVCIVKPYNEALLWRLIEVTVFSPWQKRDEKALMIKKLREKKERVRWRRFDLFSFP